MTLSSIGTAIGVVAKSAITAIGSLSVGQAIALGVVIGVGAYTGYVLIRKKKKRIQHVYRKYAKHRTVTENIMDMDVSDIGLRSKEEVEEAKAERKSNRKTSRGTSDRNVFDDLYHMLTDGLHGTGTRIGNKEEHAKARYYQELIHRAKDTPEEYAAYRRSIESEDIPPLRVPKQNKDSSQKKRKMHYPDDPNYKFTPGPPFDAEAFEREYLARKEAREKRAARNNVLNSILGTPFRVADW